MRKISFFIGSLSGGGSERVCVNLANSICAHEDWQVEVVTLSIKNNVYGSELSNSVKLNTLDVRNARYALYPIIKYFKKENIDLVIAFSYELTVLLVLIKSIFKLNVTIISRNVNNFTESTNENSTWWRRNIAIPLIKRLYSKADYYINQCDAMEKDLLKSFPNLFGKSCVIYNPIKDAIFDYVPSKKNQITSPYILCAGRLESQKNFSDAISAFFEVQKTIPELKLVIIGEGSLENKLKDHAINLGIENKVLFEGFKSNIEDYYCSAIATVLTSSYEGFPNVLLESIALGTPVVAYNCPCGPSEIIMDGVNGYLIEQYNINEMASSIIKVAKRGMSKEIVKETAYRYKSEVIMKKYLTCIADVSKKMV